MTQVPFLDLRRHHAPIRDELVAAFEAVLEASAFAGGPFVQQFEKDFAAYCGTRHCVAVGSGTDALWLALLALGVGPGDEVITVPMTFMATAEAITYAGARPVFVDIDRDTYTMDPRLLQQAITSRTRAIIPVHLYGQMADMEPILAIARAHGIPVVEDACQAHGAAYQGRRAGAWGDLGCFSFYPGKNLGALGEGGAVVTNDENLARSVAMLRDHGQARKYYHDRVGWNARMDGLQGAALQIKLKRLEAGNEARRRHATQYRALLADAGGVFLPVERPGSRHVYHLFVVRVPERDRLLRVLGERGVQCGIHYPIPVHLQEAYRDLGWRVGMFPVSEQCAAEVLSLPMFPELTEDQVEFVAQELKSCLSRHAATRSAAAVPKTTAQLVPCA